MLYLVSRREKGHGEEVRYRKKAEVFFQAVKQIFKNFWKITDNYGILYPYRDFLVIPLQGLFSDTLTGTF